VLVNIKLSMVSPSVPPPVAGQTAGALESAIAPVAVKAVPPRAAPARDLAVGGRGRDRAKARKVWTG
jgi:hypothetical protein